MHQAQDIIALFSHESFTLPSFRSRRTRTTLELHDTTLTSIVETGEPLQFKSKVSGLKPVENGSLVSVETDGNLLGKTVYTSSVEMFVPHLSSPKNEGAIFDEVEERDENAIVHQEIFVVGDTINFSSLSGDYNPLHSHSIIAKLFGSKPGATVHEMWLVGKGIGILEHTLKESTYVLTKIDASFREPVYNHSRVQLEVQEDADASTADKHVYIMEVKSFNGSKTFMEVVLTFAINK